MGTVQSNLGHPNKNVKFMQLLDAYDDKSLSPLLMRYVRDKHSNVCKSSLIYKAIKGKGTDALVWFAPVGMAENIALSDVDEFLQDAENDGFMLSYPTKEKVKELGLGGAMLMSKNFINNFIKCSTECKHCFYYFPFALSLPNSGSHATALIYNTKTKRFEWYDPVGYVSYVEHGRGSSGGPPTNAGSLVYSDMETYALGTNAERITTALTITMRNFNKALEEMGYKGLIDTKQPIENVFETCPRFGAQELEEKYTMMFRRRFELEGEIGGYCQVWAMMILDARLANPDKTPREAYMELIKVPIDAVGKDQGALLRQKVHTFLLEAYNYVTKNKVDVKN